MFLLNFCFLIGGCWNADGCDGCTADDCDGSNADVFDGTADGCKADSNEVTCDVN